MSSFSSDLVSMAKRYNMRLVLKQRFSEFFQEKVKKEHHRNLMMRMMALEVKPNKLVF